MKYVSLALTLFFVGVLFLTGSVTQQALPPNSTGTLSCENSTLVVELTDASNATWFCRPNVPTPTTVFIPTVITPSETPVPTVTQTSTTRPLDATETSEATQTIPQSTSTVSPPSPTVTVSPVVIIPTPTAGGTGPFIDVSPGQSIQDVIDRAPNGWIIRLADGEYFENIKINKPIGLIGSKNAVMHGEGQSRMIEVFSSGVIFDGFTIDGTQSGGFAGRLIYVQGTVANQYLTGLVIRNMDLKNAGGECVRLRYYVKGAIIENNNISNCGRDDYPNGTWAGGGKNGEGIYVGTAPEQTGDGKNPESGPDLSTQNVIQSNTFNTQGNECVDFKEGTTNNVARFNSCTGQKDENSGGFDSRGNNNIFDRNTIFGNVGAGIRFGGDTPSDGINNSAIGNTIRENQGYGIKAQILPQGTVCGNAISGNGLGGTNETSLNPTQPCPQGGRMHPEQLNTDFIGTKWRRVFDGYYDNRKYENVPEQEIVIKVTQFYITHLDPTVEPAVILPQAVIGYEFDVSVNGGEFRRGGVLPREAFIEGWERIE